MATSKHAKGFVDFVREQGVVGLAVGLAIGTAAGAAVKEIMREAEQFAAALRDQRMHRLVGIEEAPPCHPCDIGGKRGRA